MSASSFSFIKPYKVEFIDGPYNGAIRYYSTFYNAKRAARRYVNDRLSGRFYYSYPSCEISYIDFFGVSKFLTLITH